MTGANINADLKMVAELISCKTHHQAAIITAPLSKARETSSDGVHVAHSKGRCSPLSKYRQDGSRDGLDVPH